MQKDNKFMRILFCSEFYAPSVGGVQEVMRQIAERLVKKGHDVTIATSKLDNRHFKVLNGVNIHEFNVFGNWVSGMSGEVEAYRKFLLTFDYDVLMIKAAQQWTFDATWEIIDSIKQPKVFIPCGFSSLYEKKYAKYYEKIPEVLKSFDHLIFYASKYRDIDFVREKGMSHFTVLSNGASEVEFSVPVDPEFRARQGIPVSSFVFLTVGSFTGVKGHFELVSAFQQLLIPQGLHATLILNGNIPSTRKGLIFTKFCMLLKAHGLKYTIKHLLALPLKKLGIKASRKNPQAVAQIINQHFTDRRVLVTDLPRTELVQAYMNANLFVFASNIEYSPLVLFESAAAGTPFLTVDVGNSLEILDWTGAGFSCESYRDDKNYTRVDITILAKAMGSLMADKTLILEKGKIGKERWIQHYTWDIISGHYEAILKLVVAGSAKNNNK